MTDEEYDLSKGFKLEIGDTLKFGRVRYKIVHLHNSKKGMMKFDVNDRFARKSTKIGRLLTENENANISFMSGNSSGRLEINLRPQSIRGNRLTNMKRTSTDFHQPDGDD